MFHVIWSNQVEVKSNKKMEHQIVSSFKEKIMGSKRKGLIMQGWTTIKKNANTIFQYKLKIYTTFKSVGVNGRHSDIFISSLLCMSTQ